MRSLSMTRAAGIDVTLRKPLFGFVSVVLGAAVTVGATVATGFGSSTGAGSGSGISRLGGVGDGDGAIVVCAVAICVDGAGAIATGDGRPMSTPTKIPTARIPAADVTIK